MCPRLNLVCLFSAILLYRVPPCVTKLAGVHCVRTLGTEADTADRRHSLYERETECRRRLVGVHSRVTGRSSEGSRKMRGQSVKS
jgi:hypothetical protein